MQPVSGSGVKPVGLSAGTFFLCLYPASLLVTYSFILCLYLGDYVFCLFFAFSLPSFEVEHHLLLLLAPYADLTFHPP
jgi:hypothetical protein